MSDQSVEIKNHSGNPAATKIMSSLFLFDNDYITDDIKTRHNFSEIGNPPGGNPYKKWLDIPTCK